jgi:hypothetical protein
MSRSSRDNGRVTREPAPHQRGERLRRLVREWDWESAFKRFALLLVIVPSALLISAATAEADSGGRWSPWLLAGAIWLLLAGFTSAWFWQRMIRRGHW